MSSRKHGSLMGKIFTIFSIFTVLNIFLFLAIIFENQMELISNNSILRTRLAARDLRRLLEHTNPDTISTRADKLTKQYDLKSLRLIAPGFSTIASISGKTNTPLTREERLSVTRTLYKQEFEDKTYHQKISIAKRQIKLYIPVVSKKEIRTAIAVIRLTGFSNQYTMLIRQGIIGGLFILLAYTVLFLFTSRIIISPLRTLADATRKIAAGKLKTKVAMVRNDELGDLATNFNEMGTALQRLHNKAINANPLSGLPGNTEIVDDVLERMSRDSKFAILYCDLDNFKAYNDTYGFVKGDDVILFTRDILNEAVQSLNLDDCFVGHEGGDDFVLVTTLENYEPLANTVIRLFDAGAKNFYNKTDQKRGFIEAYNREGQYRRFRFVSISIGIVTNQETNFDTYPEIISVAAEMKKHAKATEGSGFSVNRRKS